MTCLKTDVKVPKYQRGSRPLKMISSRSPFPCSISFAADTGVIPCATAHYQKRLSDLRGFYLDPDILERRIQEENDPVCYENYAFNDSQAEGDIFFGTTIIYPARWAPSTT
jgi:oxalate decarboxylase/phosphoglucose isomerase-like protein (cupin superfamily)